MALVTLKDILSEAVKKNCAVPAFWGGDLTTCEACMIAAEEMKVPLILLVHPVANKMFGDNYELYFRFLKDMCRAVSVPVTLVLDHGRNFKQCAQFMSFGVPSLMFDGSTLPHEENIAATKEIVKMAHAAGISVEGEIGHVGSLAESKHEGDGGNAVYTEPEDALMFAKATGVDALAISIGTMHGIYAGTPNLDIERLKKIRETVGDLPLVMHGGSGLPEDQFRLAVASGINKINYVTYMQLEAVKAMKKAIDAANGGKYSTWQALEVASDAMTQVARQNFELFNTSLLSPN